MSVGIRLANSSDAERLAELCHQLGYPSTPAEVQERLRAMPRDGSHAVFVAEQEDGRVLGWVHVFELHLVESDRCAEVGGLVVDEGCRGSGVGRLLMQRAEQWAREKGRWAVYLRANIIREGAHKFYESLGYKRIKTQHAFLKKL